MNKIFTGIGSRSISKDEQDMIHDLCQYLVELGYRVRSGGARGSDAAFVKGVKECGGKSVNYIPWESYTCEVDASKNIYRDADSAAQLIASNIHPNWPACSHGAKALHTRNVFQVLGMNLNDPSDFLLACSDNDKHGDVKGGTRTAWMLAKEYNVPCLNVRGKSYNEIIEWLEGILC